VAVRWFGGSLTKKDQRTRNTIVRDSSRTRKKKDEQTSLSLSLSLSGAVLPLSTLELVYAPLEGRRISAAAALLFRAFSRELSLTLSKTQTHALSFLASARVLRGKEGRKEGTTGWLWHERVGGPRGTGWGIGTAATLEEGGGRYQACYLRQVEL
jgi:hypothetical protein